RAVAAPAASRRDKLDPVFQLCERPLHAAAIQALEDGAGRAVEGGAFSEGHAMEKAHQAVSGSLGRSSRPRGVRVGVESGRRLPLVEVEPKRYGILKEGDEGFPIG